ncbi:MAG: 30S ribosome-binding factor RbfA [Thermodesulfobacteriota bacterium]
MGKGKSRFSLPTGLAEQPNRRPVKVADLVQRILSEKLLGLVRDPALQDISISDVDMTNDLKEARILYLCVAEEADNVKKGLDRAKGFLRYKLARELSLKYVPELKFFYDTGRDHQEKMNELFAEIANEHKDGAGSKDNS